YAQCPQCNEGSDEGGLLSNPPGGWRVLASSGHCALVHYNRPEIRPRDLDETTLFRRPRVLKRHFCEACLSGNAATLNRNEPRRIKFAMWSDNS
ncbi:hypothetical protein AVEN_51908-1, partial [Araneus ventricosus]